MKRKKTYKTVRDVISSLPYRRRIFQMFIFLNVNVQAYDRLPRRRLKSADLPPRWPPIHLRTLQLPRKAAYWARASYVRRFHRSSTTSQRPSPLAITPNSRHLEGLRITTQLSSSSSNLISRLSSLSHQWSSANSSIFRPISYTSFSRPAYVSVALVSAAWPPSS